ncbi:pyridoxal phosphate-dependent decarboxylase family protein [Streptomyces sp. NPDC127100]|uniref:pyridoxal phosphate-dependent decarboxylase family protein n=1 Tax=Streptomyces sp. NPDC127100 TaxID=3347138 RepID=UPI00364F8256
MSILEPERLAATPEGLQALRGLADQALVAAQAGARNKAGPLPAGGPAALARRTRHLLPEVLPEHGTGDAEALVPLARLFSWGSVSLGHPATAAFLQCPALTVAAAADLVASAMNQSVDVWDSGPLAIELEKAVLEELRRLAGLPAGASGVTTPGGSISNLLAVIVARDTTGSAMTGADVTRLGLQSGTRRLRVVCSSEAHISVTRALAAAGLGDAAASVVPACADGRMTASAVAAALADLPPRDAAFLLMATAGTTDLGAIDPLPELADLARERGMWLHVDAAYGAGMLFSPTLKPLFAGIDRADSVTMDLHKMAWQPASSSVLLLRNPDHFAPLQREVAYLNPGDDEEAGYPNRLGRTLETTRRADALKAAAAFRALGKDGMAALVDHCHALAVHARQVVEAHPKLETHYAAVLIRVVFRYLPRRPELADQVNAALRRRLLTEGSVVIGRTERAVGGAKRIHLKLTLINPSATRQDVENLLAKVVSAGEAEEELAERAQRAPRATEPGASR